MKPKNVWNLFKTVTPKDRKRGRRSCYGRKGEESSIIASLKYEKAIKSGSFLVVGVLNHLIFDRRVMQGVFDEDVPIEKLVPTTPELLKTLKGKYGDELWFQKRIGHLAHWHKDDFRFKSTQQLIAWIPEQHLGFEKQ